MIISVFVSLGLVYVAGQVKPIELSLSIRANEKKLAASYEDMKTLRYRLASLKSPSQLKTRMIESKLELVPIKDVRVLHFAKRPAAVILSPITPERMIRPGFLQVREAQAKTEA